MSDEFCLHQTKKIYSLDQLQITIYFKSVALKLLTWKMSKCYRGSVNGPFSQSFFFSMIKMHNFSDWSSQFFCMDVVFFSFLQSNILWFKRIPSKALISPMSVIFRECVCRGERVLWEYLVSIQDGCWNLCECSGRSELIFGVLHVQVYDCLFCATNYFKMVVHR